MLTLIKLKKLQVVFLILVVIVASCDNEKHDKTTSVGHASSPNNEKSKIYKNNKKRQKSHEYPDAGNNGSMSHLSDTQISDLLKTLLSSSTLSPNSKESAKLVSGIKELLMRESPEFYEIIALLPPGYFSEKIVNQVFLEAQMEINKLQLVLKNIKDPDLAKAAINGTTSSLLVSEEKPQNININDLKFLKDQGLSEQNFAALVIQGYKSGDVSLADVSKSISPESNLVINKFIRELPPEKLKELVSLAYNNGRAIDRSSLILMGHVFAQSDGTTAMSWAQELPIEAGSIVVDGIFSEWMDADPMAASKFLAQMNKGILKDISILALVRSCVKHNGMEEAKMWMTNIEDKTIKSNATEIIRKREASPLK